MSNATDRKPKLGEVWESSDHDFERFTYACIDDEADSLGRYGWRRDRAANSRSGTPDGIKLYATTSGMTPPKPPKPKLVAQTKRLAVEDGLLWNVARDSVPVKIIPANATWEATPGVNSENLLGFVVLDED